MKQLSLKTPVSLAVAVGAVTPAPATGERPLIWSTTTGSYLGWDGSSWQRVSPKEVCQVTWNFDSLRSSIYVGANTINIDFPEMYLTSGAPVAGDTVWLSCRTEGLVGVFILGAGNLAAISVTRHPDWPTTRPVVGVRFVSTYGTSQQVLTGISTNDQTVFPPKFGIQSTDIVTSQMSEGLYFVTYPFNYRPGGSTLLVRLKKDVGATLHTGLTDNTFYYFGQLGYSSPPIWTLVDYFTGELVLMSGVGVNGTHLVEFYLEARPVFQVNASDIGYLQPIGTINNVASSYPRASLQGDFSVTSGYLSQGTVAIGKEATTESGVAIGNLSSSQAGVAIGFGARGVSEAVAIGNSATGKNYGAVAIGTNSTANTSGVSVGDNSYARDEGVSLGRYTESAKGAMALGATSVALHTGQVALLHGAAFQQGSAGWDLYKLGVVTTSATEVPLQVGYTYSGEVTQLFIDLRHWPANFSGTVTAFCDNTFSTVWKVTGTVGRVALSTAPFFTFSAERVAGSPDADAGKCKIRANFVLNGTTGRYEFSLLATGVAAKTVQWYAGLDFFWQDTSIANPETQPSPSQAIINSGTSVEVQASEALTAGQMVNLWNSSGLRVRVASGGSGYEANGYVLQDCSSGALSRVYLLGENIYLSGLTVGPLYLGAAGAVTSTPPSSGLFQRVGYAMSATKMLFQRETPIQL